MQQNCWEKEIPLKEMMFCAGFLLSSSSWEYRGCSRNDECISFWVSTNTHTSVPYFCRCVFVCIYLRSYSLVAVTLTLSPEHEHWVGVQREDRCRTRIWGPEQPIHFPQDDSRASTENQYLKHTRDRQIIYTCTKRLGSVFLLIIYYCIIAYLTVYEFISYMIVFKCFTNFTFFFFFYNFKYMNPWHCFTKIVFFLAFYFTLITNRTKHKHFGSRPSSVRLI